MKLTEQDKNKIVYLRKNGLGYRNIARFTNISVDTIKSFLRRHDFTDFEIDRERTLEDFCPICGHLLEHTPNKRRKIYCSNNCRLKAWKQRQVTKAERGADNDA